MKSITIFLTCLACTMASSPNGYNQAAFLRSGGGYGGYEAPAVPLVKAAPAYGGYEAPALVKAAPAYGGYEAPAVVKTAAYDEPAVFKAAGYEAPTLVKAAPVIPIVRYLKEDDNYGTYNLQVEGGDGTSHSEVGSLRTLNDPESEGPVNVKTGSYSWTSPEGQFFKVDYISDENGFHAVGDHLPKAPPVPAALLKTVNNYDAYSAPAAPAPVVPARAVPAYGVRAEPYARFDNRGSRY